MSDIPENTDEPVEPPARDETATPFVIANATGRITMTGIVPEFMFDTQIVPDGSAILRGQASLETDWVNGGAIAPRPANPSVLTGTVLSAVPNPSTVTINGTPYAVTDGDLDMTFPNPGTYAIAVSSPFPYLDAAFTITQ